MTDLRITGWAKDAVQAFGHATNDDLDMTRDIVRRMSPKDRAVLSLTLEEVSRIVSEEEDFRRTVDRRRARTSLEDTASPYPDIGLGRLRDI